MPPISGLFIALVQYKYLRYPQWPDLLPEGEEEGTLVTIGQRGDWPVVVKAWRKGDMVQAETLSGNEDQIIYCCRCILIIIKNALFLSR